MEFPYAVALLDIPPPPIEETRAILVCGRCASCTKKNCAAWQLPPPPRSMEPQS
jgi:hypothetical protein